MRPLGKLNLAGHDMASLIEAFDDTADEETPHCFVAYTIKVWNLPLAGHKDNHAGLMNPAQVTGLRPGMGSATGTSGISMLD